jgi:C1A family cysteine protease
MEGTQLEDAGAQIRDIIKSVNTFGACSEQLAPYVIENFKRKPSTKAYAEAKHHRAVAYKRVVNLQGYKSSLASGVPVVFGFTVYGCVDEVDASGVLAMPDTSKEDQGGHAVLAVGYDDAAQMLLVRNSWGKDWGLDGYFWMPYAYITENLADDAWAIQIVI